MRSIGTFAVLFLSCLTPALALAAGGAVGSIPGGSAVTADEVLAEARRLPPLVQTQVLSNPADMSRLVQNILLRRELARRAATDGLPNDDGVAAAIVAAREQVLAETVLQRAGGTLPDAAALQRLALTQYNATPEKFATPEQVRVRHILVNVNACEAQARAKELLAMARKPGADFAALAKENSHDPGSAARGGDLGYFGRGRMAAAFEAAAFALKQPGDISDVVKTEFGYHIIRLEERKPAGTQPFGAVRDELIKGIADSYASRGQRELIDKITGGIQFDVDAINALVAAGKPAGKPN